MSIPKVSSFEFIADVIIASGLLYYVLFVSHHDQIKAEQRALKKIANPLKVSFIFTVVRLCQLYLAVIALITITISEPSTSRLIDLFRIFGFIIFVYFISVDTLPPSESRKKKLVNSPA
jgi:L-asparagine transporter-like permease